MEPVQVNGKWRRVVRRTAAVLTFAGLGAVASACGGGSVGGSSNAAANGCPQSGTTGLTNTTIKIGNSTALSGVAAGGSGAGLQAYVDYLNSKGGVTGPDGKKRKVELVMKDDAYVATKSKTNTEELINQDKVFALLGMYGSPANVAIRPVVNKDCIPSLWGLSAAPQLGADPQYKWEGAPQLMPYSVEGLDIASLLKQRYPHGSVAILEQDDDVGHPLLAGLKKGLQGSSVKIVKVATFNTSDPNLSSQLTTLAATKAPVFLYLGSGGSYVPQVLAGVPKSGWDPAFKFFTNFSTQYFTGGNVDTLGKNVHWTALNKDPADPKWKNDPAIKLYKKWYSKQPSASKFPISSGTSGWLQGYLFEKTMEQAKTMTRQGVIDAAHHLTLDDANGGPYLPGVKLNVNYPSAPYAFTSMPVYRYNPKTNTGTLEDTIVPKSPPKFDPSLVG